MNIIVIEDKKFVYEAALDSNVDDVKVGFFRPAPPEIPANAKYRELHIFGAFKKFKKCRNKAMYKAYGYGFVIYINPIFFAKSGKDDILQFYRAKEGGTDLIILVNKSKRMTASGYNV